MKTLHWGGRITLWALLMALFLVNSKVIIRTPLSFSMLFTNTLLSPFSTQSHMALANFFWKQGLPQNAKREMTLAEDLYHATGGNVLGATTDPAAFLKEWQGEPQQLKQNYAYWKGVTVQKPDYRDAYIMTGTFAYELGNTQEALGYLQKAQTLDPNDQALNSLITEIQKGNP
ncbi:MAG TPA: hypothetical protein VMR81_06335 [Patescibacteria group bacterium]|nr:hypothetical protein [Patescibacteria group bacterium]